ncbi:unnamed protein product [Darwinula stevensoni]|uniref:Uncharacterized protein n=1 Tax=Darwinula stevensoni TaxID=69355 RepID=A0A7R9AG36_9CRUS|nr:unnamed protein product [Darwinula stevensoni]CAG0903439.1 unnamed protein product [Darwinula stevensoni]
MKTVLGNPMEFPQPFCSAIFSVKTADEAEQRLLALHDRCEERQIPTAFVTEVIEEAAAIQGAFEEEGMKSEVAIMKVPAHQEICDLPNEINLLSLVKVDIDTDEISSTTAIPGTQHPPNSSLEKNTDEHG